MPQQSALPTLYTLPTLYNTLSHPSLPFTMKKHTGPTVYYIHANPQQHGFVGDFRLYPHSSYQTHLSTLETRLNRKALLNWFSGANAYEAYLLPNQVLADLAQFEIEL
jgi:hypothetical protein